MKILSGIGAIRSEIKVISHEKNKGKGAALRTGFKAANGNFIAVQDADLEYDPKDLIRLLKPLKEGIADVVLGSRFFSCGEHRVLYFWHYIGNKFLTFISNMFTDLNLTDMETCYKVFRREILQQIKIEENRFGFEPEIVAKIAHMRLRLYEMGISYYGRTYAEGKKIGIKDGFRALYCIFRYNAHKAPLPIQFILYLLVGGVSAIINLLIFLSLLYAQVQVNIAAPFSFVFAATVNYFLCIWILFRHKAHWNSLKEIILYITVVVGVCLLDLIITKVAISGGMAPVLAKSTGSALVLFLNFIGRRFVVFPEQHSGPWQ